MNGSPAGLLTLMQIDPQHFEFLDEGFGHSRVLQRTGAVRERLLVVTPGVISRALNTELI
jgi:hypothetical protein